MGILRNQSKAVKWQHETEYKRHFNNHAIAHKSPLNVSSQRTTACQTSESVVDEAPQSKRVTTAEASVQTNVVHTDEKDGGANARRRVQLKISKANQKFCAVPSRGSETIDEPVMQCLAVDDKLHNVSSANLSSPVMQSKRRVVCSNNHNLFVTDTTKQLRPGAVLAGPGSPADLVIHQVESRQPDLQRKRIVPYEKNHNIFSTATIPWQLSRRDSQGTNLMREKIPKQMSVYKTEFTWKKQASSESPVLAALRAVNGCSVSMNEGQCYESGKYDTEYNASFAVDQVRRPASAMIPHGREQLMMQYQQIMKNRIAAYSPATRNTHLNNDSMKETYKKDEIQRSPLKKHQPPQSQSTYAEKVSDWQRTSQRQLGGLEDRPPVISPWINNRHQTGSNDTPCSIPSDTDSVYSMPYNPTKYADL